MNPIENWYMMVLEVMQRENEQTSSHFKTRLFLDRSIEQGELRYMDEATRLEKKLRWR